MWALLATTACVARYSHLPPISPADLRTPLPMRHVDVGGIDVAYVDSGGDGPPIVLVHGLSSSLGFWEHQVPTLSRTHRVLALDLPGYGASGRPDAPFTPPWYADVVSGFMDALGVPSAVVLGHSMGGQIALTLALDHPGKVDALVLSAPAGFERFSPGTAGFVKDWWHEGRALEATEEELRHTFTRVVFNRPDEGVERFLEERVRLRDTPEFAATSVAVSRSIAGMFDHPVLDRLGGIGVPTLIVFGTDDRMIPNPIFTGGRTRSIAEAGHAAIAGSELVMIPGAGHTVHHDAPVEFDAAVQQFLAKLPRDGVWGPTAETAP